MQRFMKRSCKITDTLKTFVFDSVFWKIRLPKKPNSEHTFASAYCSQWSKIKVFPYIWKKKKIGRPSMNFSCRNQAVSNTDSMLPVLPTAGSFCSAFAVPREVSLQSQPQFWSALGGCAVTRPLLQRPTWNVRCHAKPYEWMGQSPSTPGVNQRMTATILNKRFWRDFQNGAMWVPPFVSV